MQVLVSMETGWSAIDMQMLYLAGLGLVCFLGYDLWTVQNAASRWPQLLFWAGILCDGAVTVWILLHAASNWDRRLLRALPFCLAALCFLLLLIHTLFFALPFDSTYRTPSQRRPVCRTGMYALCRHPGVVWFCLFYLALYLAVPSPEALWGGGALCAGNLLYIAVQDLWIFPRTFSDYDSYRQEVPFFIPTAASVRQAWRTRHGKERQV